MNGTDRVFLCDAIDEVVRYGLHYVEPNVCPICFSIDDIFDYPILLEDRPDE